ncbi:MAG: hypothetical protein D6800_14705, partial [Candidatus Zixiibacteriota bacterium]
SAGFEQKVTVTLPQGQWVQVIGDRVQFASIDEKPNGFDCHVTVDDGDDTFTAILSNEFPRNAEGVMRKPHVKNYLAYDLYLSPLSLQRPETNNPGVLSLNKGESKSVGGYTFTFHDFEMHNHGETTDSLQAIALVTVTGKNYSEDLRPSLLVHGDMVRPISTTFDSGRGTVYISGVRPEDGGVILTVEGDFLPPVDIQTASLVVEVSRKPLILLFWLGTALAFLGGFFSMFQFRRRRRGAGLETVAVTEEPRVHVTS